MDSYTKSSIAIILFFLGTASVGSFVIGRAADQRCYSRDGIAVSEFDIAEAEDFVQLYCNWDTEAQIAKFTFDSVQIYDGFASREWINERADIGDWEVVSSESDFHVLTRSKELNEKWSSYEEARFSFDIENREIYFAWVQVDINLESDSNSEQTWVDKDFWHKFNELRAGGDK